ncbi:MAG: diguanylate cyclase [Deltaproteobacteria bacterium]|nr:diguanylate cyclase [Deltaproteobacteria bacterium]
MEYADPTGARLSRPRRFGWILLGVWTLVVAASLIWNLAQQRRETLDLAYTTAITLYEKDLLYRRWAAGHSGVYVPVTAATPPSPYLSHLPERDLQTPSSRRLTLINPAYMTRQVYELAQESGQPQGHLHSLKPLRPGNVPDHWETAALKAFEQGQPEARGIEKLDGKEVFRLMRPFITEKSCLGCHAGQGYRVGEIRGGISLTVPMASLRQAQDSMMVALVGGHGLLWLLGVLGIVVAVRNLEKAHLQIITLVNTDSLTHLANRRFFIDFLEKAMAFAKRHGQALSVIMADLDHFKAINDTYGHQAGDQVLAAFAQVMQASIRQEDLAARFGGEEFIVMLPGTTLEDATILAERLRESLENLTFPPMETRVTASFGIAQYQPDDTFETLVKRADEGLYAAKAAGRNRVMTG